MCSRFFEVKLELNLGFSYFRGVLYGLGLVVMCLRVLFSLFFFLRIDGK